MNRILLTTAALLSLLPCPEARIRISLKPDSGKKPITLDHVVGSPPIRTTPVLSGIRWLPDGKRFLYRPAERKKSSTWIQHVRHNRNEPFLDPGKIRAAAGRLEKKPKPFQPSGYTPSRDFQRFLYEQPDGYLVYDRKANTMTRVTSTRKGKTQVSFSPTGTHVAYVCNNDLYALDSTSSREIRFTRDGNENILNGVHSWVYYEEFFNRNERAFWWSPDGEYIAFFRFDDSRVHRLTLVDEIPTGFREVKQRYPKAGMDNPGIKLGVARVKTGEVTWMDPGAGPEDYLAHVAWTPDSRRVAVQVFNRLQNDVKLVLCDPETGTGAVSIHETSSSWIDVREDVFHLEKSKDILWASEKSGYRHIHRFDRNGTCKARLTSGKWSVRKILGVDERKKKVYFLGDRGSSLERHLFVVGLNGKGVKRLTGEEGTHTITLSPDCGHFIDSYTSLTVPKRVVLKDCTGNTVRVLGESRVVGTDEYVVCTPEFFEYRTGDGTVLPGLMLKPPGFKSSKRYPLLVSIYGGPAAQGVANRWQLTSRNMLGQALAQAGMVVVKLDHRGAGHHGHAGCARMYGDLGRWEIADWSDAVRFLVTRGLVDPDRVGIWGWSYGGYATCMALVRAPDVFGVGVAVAPVTDWKNYDTIYTERYMGLPGENRKGYRSASVLTHAKNLKGKLLVMHGTMDDNVHFQNAVQLARALVRAGRQFDIMIYPQGKHGIGANNARPHLFRKLFDHLTTNLLKEKARRRL